MGEVVANHIGGFLVECTRCVLKSARHYATANEAAKSWNTRPIEAALQEENATLRQLLTAINNHCGIYGVEDDFFHIFGDDIEAALKDTDK